MIKVLKRQGKDLITILLGNEAYPSCCDIQHFKIMTKIITLYQDTYKFQKLYIISRMSILITFIHTIYSEEAYHSFDNAFHVI